MSRVVASAIHKLGPVSSIPEKELEWILQHARRTRTSFRSLVDARATGKPLQLVLGTQPFLDLDICCAESVLVPRPETEQWCSWLANYLEDEHEERQTVLEIGSGTGCVSLSLALHLPYYRIIGIDVDSNAVRNSLENKRISKLSNVQFHHLSFLDVDLKSQLASLNAAKVNLLVSNPPYIADHEWHQLDADVRRYESPQALCSGHLGLDMIRVIIFQARDYLIPRTHDDQRASLVLEFGQEYQTASIRSWLSEAGFDDIVFRKDFSGRSRFVTSRFSGNNRE